MSNDWQAGDLALCVRGGEIDGLEPMPDWYYPKAGAVYVVADALESAQFWDRTAPALKLPEAPPNADCSHEWGAIRFIKVTPPEADEFDREVIDQLAGVTA